MVNGLARAAMVTAALYAARRFYRNWGATKEECQLRLPGDELVGEPTVQTTSAVWIDAPAPAIWPWLVQIGQDRGGVYSYQALENVIGLRYRNADRIHPEWQRLAPGDVVRLVPSGWMGLRNGVVLQVDQVMAEKAIVLRGGTMEVPWDAVWSFHVVPHWQDRCRLLVRTRTRLRHPGEALGLEAVGPVTALVIRGMLLGIKRRVEAQHERESQRPNDSRIICAPPDSGPHPSLTPGADSGA
ncbi:SRPBCC family protein [Mycobacterium sp.]|uniref:SRPBCC family protein n=1 Tax=Mycobacterium sp. TaxID=1785 RepID=UPI002D10A6AE|nr:SRPBCC family protein [Mycobacterium sp.]HME46730.1 SRPBCC family protein [Mycobacterium sp.]